MPALPIWKPEDPTGGKQAQTGCWATWPRVVKGIPLWSLS